MDEQTEQGTFNPTAPEKSWTMRAPCRDCGHPFGRIETRGGQDVVRCEKCGLFQYNAPKVETGRAVRSVSSVHEALKPKQKVAIRLRANGRCELCGIRPGEGDSLHVGHVLSVEEGMKLGLTESELNEHFNLTGLCSECNCGLGSESLPPRFMLQLYRLFLAAQRRGAING